MPTGTPQADACRRLQAAGLDHRRCDPDRRPLDPLAYCRRVWGTDEWTRRCLHLNDFDPYAYCRRIWGTDEWTRRCARLADPTRPAPDPTRPAPDPTRPVPIPRVRRRTRPGPRPSRRDPCLSQPGRRRSLLARPPSPRPPSRSALSVDVPRSQFGVHSVRGRPAPAADPPNHQPERDLLIAG
jgi:hypothetical protein